MPDLNEVQKPLHKKPARLTKMSADNEVCLVSDLLIKVKLETAAKQLHRVVIEKKIPGTEKEVELHTYFCKNALECFIKGKTINDYIAVLRSQLHASCNEIGYGIHVLGTVKLHNILLERISSEGMLILGVKESTHDSLIWMHIVWYAEITNMIMKHLWLHWDSAKVADGRGYIIFLSNNKLFVRCSQLKVDICEICELLQVDLETLRQKIIDDAAMLNFF